MEVVQFLHAQGLYSIDDSLAIIVQHGDQCPDLRGEAVHRTDDEEIVALAKGWCVWGLKTI